MLRIDAQREYDRLRTWHDAAEGLLAWPEARLFEAVPEVSGWAPAQHLHHVAVINRQIFKTLEATVDGRLTPEAEGRTTLPALFVLGLGRIPRGRVRTLAAYEPPAEVPMETLAETLAQVRGLLDGLGGHLPTLARLDGRVPHPRLGPLTARQWLRFARIHTEHHARIVHDIDARRPAALVL